jgi:two-component system, NtrC family, sensor histidine kinase KinB
MTFFQTENLHMKRSFPVADLYRWTIGILGLLLLIAVSLRLQVEPADLLPVFLIGMFIGFQVFFSLEVFGSEVTLNSAILLGSALLVGPAIPAWGSLLGVIVGFVSRKILPNYRQIGRSSFHLSQVAYSAGLCLVPLLVATFLVGFPVDAQSFGSNAGAQILPFLIFPVVHAGLFLADIRLKSIRPRKEWGKESLSLALLELLPLPFAWLVYRLAGTASPDLQTAALLLLGGVPVIVTLLLFKIRTTRTSLERRLEELSTLNRISRSVRASVDLENLLDAIHMQITRLLDVDNFYVALYDPNDQQIWYPLAVKHGQRRQWPRRPLVERLTDRVIREGKPILIPHHAQQELARIGEQQSEESPYAWIGVPLIASNRTIGCLALFSVSTDVEFSEEDLNVLTILSGQTSMAIEASLQNSLQIEDVGEGSEQISSVFDSVGEGFVLIEASGQIAQVNEAVKTITGLKPEEIVGKRLSDLADESLKVLGYTRQEAREFMLNLEQGQFSPLPQISGAISSGQSDLYLERVSAIARGPGGSPIGLVIIIRDITEEKQSAQARDLVTETLVHDMRSPISAVLGALDVMEEAIQAGESDEISQPSISIARRSAQRVLGMVESMLEIARLQSGSLDLVIAPAQLDALVDQVLSDFQNLSAGYQVQLVDEVTGGLPDVYIDKDKILRVLTNLVDNALKFTPEGGTVCLSVGLFSGDKLIVRVSDTGPGIPEEYREKIFNRFGQVPGQIGRRRGSGLGLTFCRLAVEAHGGEIWMEAGPEGGSVFAFTLPCFLDRTATVQA